MVEGRERRATKLGSDKKKTHGDKAGYNRKEKEIANVLGGFRQPASGALDHRKGDVSISSPSLFQGQSFLLDSKQSEGSSILLSGKDITKICREATGEMKEPGIVFTIEKIAASTPKSWVAVPLDVFATLLENQRGYTPENRDAGQLVEGNRPDSG